MMKSQAVLDDQHVFGGAHDAARFAQDELDQPRILVHALRQLDRLDARHDGGEFDAPALGLGDYFLRKHQHVAASQGEPTARQRLRRQGGQIIAAGHLRKAGQRDQAQFGPPRSSKRCAQPGQDLIRVQIQETRLIGSGSVKHEVPETHVDVGPDLLHVLVRIRRDDPALGGALRRQLIRQPLHFERILDRDLLLGRERERGPMAGVLAMRA